MTPQTSINLAKQLLLACDQSYFDGSHAPATVLGPLPDMTSTDPDYINLNIYTDIPQFSWQGDYEFEFSIEDVATGAKLVIYQNKHNDEVIVAFGGTDGTDLKDWVANSQSVGWNQWAALKDPERGNLFGRLAALNPTQVHFTGQSLGGALAQYAAYDYLKDKSAPLPNGQPNPFNKSSVTLTTFNGLGACRGRPETGSNVTT